MNHDMYKLRPSSAFIAAARAALVIGIGAYVIGLWTSTMSLNEKGFYFASLLLGLFAAISLQKTVRDKLEGIRVTGTYMNVCWAALVAALAMVTIGLFNATFELATKGFFGMAYALSLFAVLTVQKNVRDMELFRNPKDDLMESVGELRSSDHQ